MSVAGVVFTLVGGLTVLVIHDQPTPPSGVKGENQPAPAADQGAGTVTTTLSAPVTTRPAGTIGSAPGPRAPASATAPPPATPEEVAQLLAGLPRQLEQAATSSGQPRELPAEEVDRLVDEVLRQLGAKP